MSDFAKDNDFLKSVMQNKILFVYGEGGSHNLELNNQMRIFLLRQFSNMNLKYFFIENGRTTAFNNNQYLRDTNQASDSTFWIDTAFRNQMKEIKRIYNSGFHFDYKGIDMEWSKNFYRAVKSIAGDIGLHCIDSIKLLRSILVDTTYLHYDNRNNFNNQKLFLQKYKELKNLFFDDSTILKEYLSADRYKQLAYFLSNPQTAPPLGNRNAGMAQNLLAEISPIDTAATYLLDIGLAHSLLNRKNGVVSILNRSDLLSNKIMIMNVYCDSCRVNENLLKDRLIDFMTDNVLEAFRESTKGDLTIFNVADVPAKFNYLKKYGDLILFAKNQK